nr:MAG TPA: Origin recognition complex subunit [Caudoviricetes sp.]
MQYMGFLKPSYQPHIRLVFYSGTIYHLTA